MVNGLRQHAPYIPPRERTPRRLRAPSPRLRGEGWDEGALPQGSDFADTPLTRIAELVIGPATAGRTRWQSDLSPRSGERKASHPRLKNCTARSFFCAAARLANVSRLRRPSASLDKIHNALDVFEDLLFRFIAFGGLCRQPSAAGRKQLFKGVADQGISIKVSGDHTKSSAITIRGRLIVAANGVAHAHEQGL
jgi:hypothetical protein